MSDMGRNPLAMLFIALFLTACAYQSYQHRHEWQPVGYVGDGQGEPIQRPGP